jgi:hypothetical protein
MGNKGYRKRGPGSLAGQESTWHEFIGDNNQLSYKMDDMSNDQQRWTATPEQIKIVIKAVGHDRSVVKEALRKFVELNHLRVNPC